MGRGNFFGRKYFDFFFNDTATTESYTLSLHDALPIFGQTFGGAGGGAPQAIKGQDRTITITVTFMTALKGGVEEIPVGDTTVQLRIPKGIQSGKKLRLKGKGELGVVGGQAGDLLVQVTVGGHPLYQRRGLDVDMDVDLNITEASLGTKVTLDRKSTRLNSSHVVISYAVFCLKKKTKNHKQKF